MVIGNINRSICFSFCNDFQSGLVSKMGVEAYACWSCLRHHANFDTGHATPSIRTVAQECNLSKTTAEKYLSWILDLGLARVVLSGGPHRSTTYILRERIEVRSGDIVTCWLFVDYVPTGMKDRIELISNLLRAGDNSLIKFCSIIPAHGYIFDDVNMTLMLDPNAVKLKVEQKVQVSKPIRTSGSKNVFDLVQHLGYSR